MYRSSSTDRLIRFSNKFSITPNFITNFRTIKLATKGRLGFHQLLTNKFEISFIHQNPAAVSRLDGDSDV